MQRAGGCSLEVVRERLIAAASLVSELRLQRAGLQGIGAWAHSLAGSWNLPGAGTERVSSALAGVRLTPGPGAS